MSELNIDRNRSIQYYYNTRRPGINIRRWIRASSSLGIEYFGEREKTTIRQPATRSHTAVMFRQFINCVSGKHFRRVLQPATLRPRYAGTVHVTYIIVIIIMCAHHLRRPPSPPPPTPLPAATNAATAAAQSARAPESLVVIYAIGYVTPSSVHCLESRTASETIVRRPRKCCAFSGGVRVCACVRVRVYNTLGRLAGRATC